jgi:hypothetical protein
MRTDGTTELRLRMFDDGRGSRQAEYGRQMTHSPVPGAPSSKQNRARSRALADMYSERCGGNRMMYAEGWESGYRADVGVLILRDEDAYASLEHDGIDSASCRAAAMVTPTSNCGRCAVHNSPVFMPIELARRRGRPDRSSTRIARWCQFRLSTG